MPKEGAESSSNEPRIFEGTPATETWGGTSASTTLLAPTRAPSPISTFPNIFAPAPISTPDRILGCLSPLSFPVPLG